MLSSCSVHSPEAAAMKGPTARLPWSREFLTVFRLSGSHPIVWHRDRFVVSGRGFVVYNCVISAVFLSNALGRCVWPKPTNQMALPSKFGGNPIANELEAFMLLLYLGFQLAAGGLIIALTSQRAKIARVSHGLCGHAAYWLIRSPSENYNRSKKPSSPD